jgi:hypothetical protein
VLQPSPVAACHAHRRVQREPIHLRAQRTLRERLVPARGTEPSQTHSAVAAVSRRAGTIAERVGASSSRRVRPGPSGTHRGIILAPATPSTRRFHAFSARPACREAVI